MYNGINVENVKAPPYCAAVDVPVCACIFVSAKINCCEFVRFLFFKSVLCPMEFHYGICHPLFPVLSPTISWLCVWAFNISFGSLFAMILLLIIRIEKTDLWGQHKLSSYLLLLPCKVNYYLFLFLRNKMN